MNFAGTIQITSNWAQLDLDAGQQLQGPLILMRPIPEPASDQNRIGAAYQFFYGLQGAHYTLTGLVKQSGGLNYLIFTMAVKG